MPAVSLIVPVRDGAAYLSRTLPPLLAARPAGAEVLICDDGSRDGSAELAEALGARVLRSPKGAGPAAARNRGAAAARGELLVFLDADVSIHADTIARLLEPFSDPTVAAAFGSYDDRPPGTSWVSLYKNLAHHFVHQRSCEGAFTFWAGCGAVRAEAFRSLGGFDESYLRPSIEDVELGYRLREAGRRIRLVREAQVTHLKRWTLGSWLLSDLRDRALPWARLLRAGRPLPRDLNFTLADRTAAAGVALALASLPLALVAPWLAIPSVFGLLVSLAADRDFLRFAARRVSPAFAAAAAVFQLLHRAAAVLGLAAGLLLPARLPRAPKAA